MLAPGFALTPDPREVAEMFEVPLAFLLRSRQPAAGSRGDRAAAAPLYAFTHGEHQIWGATAAIIVNLAERLDGISLNHAD